MRLLSESQWKTRCWRPLYANPALCSMLGFTEAELLKQALQAEFLSLEDARHDWALFEQFRAGSIDSYHLDKRFIRKDSTLVWGRLSISLMKNPADSTRLVIAMVEDISEKKAAEEKVVRGGPPESGRPSNPGAGGGAAAHRSGAS